MINIIKTFIEDKKTELTKEQLDKMKIKKLMDLNITGEEKIEVWIVDGNYIRTDGKIDNSFSGGTNWMADTYCPDHNILLEQADNLSHEFIESTVMGYLLNDKSIKKTREEIYQLAHIITTTIETFLRDVDPKFYDKLDKKQEEGQDEELRAGIIVEFEHLPTYKWLKEYLDKNDGEMPPVVEFQKHIAVDHIREYPDYYTRLSTIIDDVPIK
jgi:hypothetical protein